MTLPRLESGRLLFGEQTLLSEVSDTIHLFPDPRGVGVFLRFQAEKAQARHVIPLGNLHGLRRFTACHRYEPFWMKPKAGTRGGEVPIETQTLLIELETGGVALLIPLLDGAFRAALQGAGETVLEIVFESGDPAVVTDTGVGLFAAVGDNPYWLFEEAAQSVLAYLGTGRRRIEKPLPAFVERFGWCTWDAFYQAVSHDKIRAGLESFAAGGVQPRVLILDDGWQSVRALPSGERRLTGFSANSKFPGDLASTVAMCKDEFGIESFFVWHALNGYWGGVDGEALPGYGVRSTERRFSESILHHVPGIAQWWGSIVGVVPPETIYRFFQDYHRHLRKQGVDGVKVDNQAALEGVAYGFGGRVALMQHYHEALEGSAQTHFLGNLINCMSCANEMIYCALNSNVIRTSTDFWPNRPESHGLHLYTNAQVSLWVGEFFLPDWDMFQSGHPAGAYHAAARAVGGCPVYVSDKPDAHDFDLLRKLALPDGRVLRAPYPGKPTRDCLFHDPTREDVLLKIFNRNTDDMGILGAFHAKYHADGTETAPISGSISPADVEGLEGEQFAVYAHYAGELRAMQRADLWEITLEPLTAEIFTLVAIEEGIAPIGLKEMFNSAGAIEIRGIPTEASYLTGVKGGGTFLCYCEHTPAEVYLNDAPVAFTYDAETSRLEVVVPFEAESSVVEVWFEE